MTRLKKFFFEGRAALVGSHWPGSSCLRGLLSRPQPQAHVPRGSYNAAMSFAVAVAVLASTATWQTCLGIANKDVMIDMAQNNPGGRPASPNGPASLPSPPASHHLSPAPCSRQPACTCASGGAADAVPVPAPSVDGSVAHALVICSACHPGDPVAWQPSKYGPSLPHTHTHTHTRTRTHTHMRALSPSLSLPPPTTHVSTSIAGSTSVPVSASASITIRMDSAQGLGQRGTTGSTGSTGPQTRSVAIAPRHWTCSVPYPTPLHYRDVSRGRPCS